MVCLLVCPSKLCLNCSWAGYLFSEHECARLVIMMDDVIIN